MRSFCNDEKILFQEDKSKKDKLIVELTYIFTKAKIVSLTRNLFCTKTLFLTSYSK
jgi:hypothetical protein